MAGSNNFDGVVLLDQGVGSAASPGDYFGFGRAAGGEVSTGPRLLAGTGSPNGVTTAPAGSLWLRTDGGIQLWQNTDGGTTWVQIGNLSGSVTLSAIDTTATAAFQWTAADNAAAAVSIGAAGALSMLVLDTTNGSETVVIGAANGLRINDSSELRFGTPGTDVLFSADGTNVTVSGTGTLRAVDNFVYEFGTDGDVNISYNSANNRYQGVSDAVSGAAALAASSGFRFESGARTTTDAAAGTGSGSFFVVTGATDITDGGGSGGASGEISMSTGPADSTAGTSGASGGISFTTGTSADGATGNILLVTGAAAAGNSGNISLTTGTAGGTRGQINLNSPTVSVAGQATTLAILDNSATSLRVREGTNDYLQFDSTNSSEQIILGNLTQNQTVNFATLGPILTNGTDHGTRLVLVEQFNLRPQLAASIANNAASKTWEVAGTNATDAGSVFDVGGGIALTTGALANDQQIIIPHTAGADNSQSPFQGTSWSTSDQVIGKFNFKVIDTANTMLFAGFKITTTIDTGNDDNQLYVGYNSAGTLGGVAANFVVVESVNTVDAQTDTTVACVAGSYRVVIAWQSDRTARVYLNGVLRRTTAAYPAAFTTMKPMAGVQALAGASRQFTVQRISCSKVYA